jgi:2-isopropylmalate synthase
MLKERTTYEIMRPEDVGFTKTDLVLGKHSGRAALADRARALGYHLEADQLQSVFDAFKELADKKKDIYDGDIAALIEQQIHNVPDLWEMVSYQVQAASGQSPTVRLTLRRGDEEFTEVVCSGDGPLDALFLAIERLTGISVICRDFQVHSVTRGKDAQADATVEAEHEGQLYRGHGVSTDSVEAGALAYLNAVNRVAISAGRPARREATDTVEP